MTQHPLMAALTLSVPEMILAATAQRCIGLGPQAPRSLRAGRCAKYQGDSSFTVTLSTDTCTIVAVPRFDCTRGTRPVRRAASGIGANAACAPTR